VFIGKFDEFRLLGSRDAVDGEYPINPPLEIFCIKMSKDIFLSKERAHLGE